MHASSRGHVGLVAWLLEHGACANQRDLDGFTALTHAATGRRGTPEVLAFLIERGGAEVKEREGEVVSIDASCLCACYSIPTHPLYPPTILFRSTRPVPGAPPP